MNKLACCILGLFCFFTLAANAQELRSPVAPQIQELLAPLAPSPLPACTPAPASYAGLHKFTYRYYDPVTLHLTQKMDMTLGLTAVSVNGHEEPLLQVFLLMVTNPNFTVGGMWCTVRDEIYNQLNLSYGTIDWLYQNLAINAPASFKQAQSAFASFLGPTTYGTGGQPCPDMERKILNPLAVNSSVADENNTNW